MRVAVMLRAFDERGGVGVYARNLVSHLLALDSDDEYLLLYRDPAHLGTYGHLARVTERCLTAQGKAHWDQVAVPRAAREFGADVILHPKFTVPLACEIPSVMVLHGADWFLPGAARFYGRLDRIYMRIFMPLYLHRARLAVSVSQLTTADFNRLFRLPASKVRTVYFGPAEHFRRVEDPVEIDRVRRKYGLPERYILTLSRVDDGGRKNAAGLFRAFQEIFRQTGCSLVVGGAGLERWREDYGIPDQDWGAAVHFPGYMEQADLPALYSGACLYLYPSNQEAFPIPLTEAMACGVPIVTSNVNGLAEIAGDAAELVDPASPEDIARATVRMMRDPEVRAARVAAGHARSLEFSWQKCATTISAILREAAQSGSRP